MTLSKSESDHGQPVVSLSNATAPKSLIILATSVRRVSVAVGQLVDPRFRLRYALLVFVKTRFLFEVDAEQRQQVDSGGSTGPLASACSRAYSNSRSNRGWS